MAEVAPLAGSVDRNNSRRPHHIPYPVTSLPSRGAWIEIWATIRSCIAQQSSLPSRGAWIEIADASADPAAACVAPLAGSVDRNALGGQRINVDVVSLPSRGAWIEMAAYVQYERDCLRRSPRGERG